MDNGANTAHMYMVPMLPATINAISLWNPWGTEQDSLSVVITVIVTEQVLDLHVKHEKKEKKKFPKIRDHLFFFLFISGIDLSFYYLCDFCLNL